MTQGTANLSRANGSTATTPTMALAPFVRQRTALLTTYRRDGRPVGTPVHIAVDGHRVFIRTWDQAWKLKRLRRNPAVTIAPSTTRGKVTGPAVSAHARILSGDESAYAAKSLARKYPILHGALIPWGHRLKGYTTIQIELTPVSAAA